MVYFAMLELVKILRRTSIWAWVVASAGETYPFGKIYFKDSPKRHNMNDRNV